MVSSLGDNPAYETFSRLVRVQTALWHEVDARLRRQHGIALSDVTALQIVADTSACRVQDIVSTLHITVGGASKVVDRLVGAGHVARSPHPSDRRSSLLEVTASGLEMLERVAPDVQTVLQHRLQTILTTRDLGELDRILTLLQGSSATTEQGVSS